MPEKLLLDRSFMTIGIAWGPVADEIEIGQHWGVTLVSRPSEPPSSSHPPFWQTAFRVWWSSTDRRLRTSCHVCHLTTGFEVMTPQDRIKNSPGTKQTV